MYEIIIGRNKEDQEKFGYKATGIIGKHYVGSKKDAHLANPVRIDLARPHLIGIFGKRGGGKSYTLGVLAEELAELPDEIKNNISTLLVDTMGIYWSMKVPNDQDRRLLVEQGLNPRGYPIKILIPAGYEKYYIENDVDFDGTFSFKPYELGVGEWALSFNINLDTEIGILLQKVVDYAQENLKEYDIPDLIKITEKEDATKVAKDAIINRFMLAKKWGIFDMNAPSVYDIVLPGQLSVIDVSQLGLETGGWSVRSLVVGLLGRKILIERMKARRLEEFEDMDKSFKGKKMPITWMLIDEAHQFLPAVGETAATGPLLQWIKIGREPGVSLVLATQMPYKLHQEAISQCDLVISHRLTAKKDMDALSSIMQTYYRYDLSYYYDALPRVKGTALILDDNSERIYEIRVRPRKSWHAGGGPVAIKQ